MDLAEVVLAASLDRALRVSPHSCCRPPAEDRLAPTAGRSARRAMEPNADLLVVAMVALAQELLHLLAGLFTSCTLTALICKPCGYERSRDIGRDRGVAHGEQDARSGNGHDYRTDHRPVHPSIVCLLMSKRSIQLGEFMRALGILFSGVGLDLLLF